MRKFLAIFLIIFLLGCVNNSGKFSNKIFIESGGKLTKINIEIADDKEKLARGLMFRKTLEENSGMLFVFQSEEIQTFWMKNTLIPLDMIFIDKNLKIVNIEHAAPCLMDPCLLYKSAKPSKYVLEVNGNFTARMGIKEGNHLTLG